MSEHKQNADWIARITSILSITVSVAGIYFTSIRPAAIQVDAGQYVLLKNRPLVGVLCTFSNAGARQAVITSTTLEWDSPSATFQAAMMSHSLEQWEYKNGKQETSTPTRYTILTPIAVKEHDQVTAVLWFATDDDSFKFTSGTHSCRLKVSSRGEQLAQVEFEVMLEMGDITSISEHPEIEFPIKIIGQK